ncbi:MAG: LysR family transcriptional regulator [Longicatena sp.]
MSMRHLKIFIAVCDCGKMSSASKLLFISQPSVSQAIKELEDTYQTKLFERLNRKLFITESGKALLTYARHIVDSYEAMDIQMKYAQEHPTIRIGASVSVGTCLLLPIIEKMQQTHPNIQIEVTINNTAYIENLLENSQLDIGLVEGVVVGSSFKVFPLCKDELVVVVGKKHPFYHQHISLDKLANQKLIAREDGSTQRNQYERLLEDEHINLVKTWSSTNTEAIKNAVIAGYGLTILSKMLVEKEVKNGSLYIVPIEGIQVARDIKLIHHQHKFLSDSVLAFIATCKEVYHQNKQ